MSGPTDCGRSFVQESTTAVIETGLCAHSSPTADICANMMPQLGVSLDLIGRCQNLVMADNRVRRESRHHDYAAEQREA